MTACLTGDFFEHVTREGDRWDMLAWRYYGDQHLQTVILEANRGLYVDGLVTPPAILPHGVTLRIPVIEAQATNEASLPPWKRAIPIYGGAQ